ncbi:hypothetical protein [Streptomyces sp. NPDC048385]|uniref:hypothetical protein n=1 Tax=unclassified Streptomyces TaxID=2593676 RepID=UPI003417BC5F
MRGPVPARADLTGPRRRTQLLPGRCLVGAGDRTSPPSARRPAAERAGATVGGTPDGQVGHVARPETVVGVIEGVGAAG